MTLPAASVVITTAGETRFLAQSIESVLACEYERLEVIVVDNRPALDMVRPLLASRFGGEDRLRCVAESRRGLSWARNAGLSAAGGEVVLFTDDDVVVDPGWVRAIAERFRARATTACVTGRIMPLELQTRAQLLLEQLMALNKGPEHRLYGMRQRDADPLFPYAAGRFGSGANTALRTAVAREHGGFDTALGAGTPSRGGEELDLYIRLLLAGHELEYEPRAIVWHRHPREMRALRRQAFSYGVGLMAAISKQLVSGPERGRLLRLVPAGIRHVLDPRSRKNELKAPGYPRALDVLEWVGMLAGPIAYASSRLKSREGGRMPGRSS